MKLLRKLDFSQALVLFFLLLASCFFFWKVPETLQFQGDQGRDALIVSDIFRNGNFVFIGPVTSVGNMYLGPLYYYFMLPFLFLSYPSPLGPVYAIGLLSVLTVFLMYYLGKRMFSQKVGLIAIAIYAINAVVATYSRFSWNPNPAPLFSLLMVYFSYKAWQDHPKYWVLVSLCFSVLMQLHYLTLLTLAGAGLVWLFHLVEILKTNSATKQSTTNLPSLITSLLVDLRIQKKAVAKPPSKIIQFISYTVISIFIYITTITPLLLFDLKHDGLNRKALVRIFAGESVFVKEELPGEVSRTVDTIKESHGRSLHIIYDMFIGVNAQRNTVLLTIELIALFFILRKVSDSEKKPLIVLAAFILMGILGTSLYKSTIFTHYIIYLLPLVTFYHAFVFSKIKLTSMTTLPLIALYLAYALYNFRHLPFQAPGWQLSDIEDTADSIYQRLEPGEKYNIVLLSESGDIDGQNYRYFLSTTDIPPLPIERRGETETLFIINEDKILQKVTDSPIYEIVVFPDKDIKEVYTINNGPEITVLKK